MAIRTTPPHPAATAALIAVRTGGRSAVTVGKENSFHYLGTLVRVLVTGEDTHGQVAVIETQAQHPAAPPRHIHTREDEVVYILEGLVRFYMDGAWRDCPPGTCVLLPKGGEHTFVVRSEAARLLVILVPAGLEGSFRELGVPAASPAGCASADGQPDVERLITVAARYGVAITGPAPRATSEANGPTK